MSNYYNAEGQARMRLDEVNDYYDSFATIYEPEPRTVMAWSLIGGAVCRTSDDHWPGAPTPVLIPTRYDVCEMVSDSDLSVEQREGGAKDEVMRRVQTYAKTMAYGDKAA